MLDYKIHNICSYSQTQLSIMSLIGDRFQSNMIIIRPYLYNN